MPSQNTNRSIIGLAISLCIGIAIGITVQLPLPAKDGAALPAIIRSLAPSATGTSTFQDVWKTIHTEYVNANVSDEQLVTGAIRGLVAALGDPYSVYLSPTEAKAFAEEVAGSFEGVGMELGLKNNVLTVIAPLTGSPAEHAGMRSGDVVIAINDADTSQMTVDEAVKLIRGKKGTKVDLTVSRTGSDPFTVTLERQTITIDSVTSRTIDQDGKKISVIKISSFNQDTERLFRQVAQRALNDRVSGFVIDLRNNPGGYLDQAVRVASVAIPSGTIVSEIDRDGQKRNLDARGGAILNGQKMVVLINGGSASASEIVAGAFQDTHVATLIGEKSYGKGSVQQLADLHDGSSLKLTVAKWYTPSGRSIADEGIAPDTVVTISDADVTAGKDPQMDAAVTHLLQP